MRAHSLEEEEEQEEGEEEQEEEEFGLYVSLLCHPRSWHLLVPEPTATAVHVARRKPEHNTILGKGPLVCAHVRDALWVWV